MAITIHTTPGHPEIDSLCRRLAEEGVPPEAKLIYRARNSVYTLALSDGTEVNIKAFKVPRGLNPYIYSFIRKSKARRSFINSLRLMQHGLNAPEPLGYVEVRRGPRLAESYFVSRQIKADDMRHWEEKPDSAPILHALAEEMHKFHREGVWHKDFSPGNILYTVTPDGKYRFYYIDLNRMKFGVHDRARQMKMFRAVNIESEDETARLGRYYAEAAGLDPDVYSQEARRQLRDFLSRKHKLHALKRAIFPRHKA